MPKYSAERPLELEDQRFRNARKVSTPTIASKTHVRTRLVCWRSESRTKTFAAHFFGRLNRLVPWAVWCMRCYSSRARKNVAWVRGEAWLVQVMVPVWL